MLHVLFMCFILYVADIFISSNISCLASFSDSLFPHPQFAERQSSVETLPEGWKWHHEVGNVTTRLEMSPRGWKCRHFHPALPLHELWRMGEQGGGEWSEAAGRLLVLKISASVSPLITGHVYERTFPLREDACTLQQSCWHSLRATASGSVSSSVAVQRGIVKWVDR